MNAFTLMYPEVGDSAFLKVRCAALMLQEQQFKKMQ